MASFPTVSYQFSLNNGPVAKEQEPLSDYEKKYHQQVAQLRLTPYMDYPSHVHMETISMCTAACNFCPYPTLERKGKKMSDELVEKIINDLMEIPRHVSFQLSPFKVNEPFLDIRLFDILATINEKLPQASISLTTNASPISERRLKKLMEIKKIEYLWISCNDHRKEHYEKVMQLDYDKTMERLELIHSYFKQGLLPFRIVLSRVGDRSPADNEFLQWVQTKFPGFQANVFPRGNWLGQVGGIEQKVPNIGCVRWFELSITSTGIVAHCCMDGQAKYPIGDVTTQSVLEIYNSPHYRQLRESTLSRLDASPCNSCAFL